MSRIASERRLASRKTLDRLFHATCCLSSAGLLGCGASEEPATSQKAMASAVSDAICDAVEELPAIKSGDTFSMNAGCIHVNPERHHYNGSSANDISAFISQPFLMGQAYYCALADAHGAEASALIPTAIGRFGIESLIWIDKRDPAGGAVHGHRIGRLYLFGLGMDVQSQGMSWSLSNETRPAGTVAARRADGTNYTQNVTNQIGYHNKLVAEGAMWNVHMNGSWRAGPVGMSIDGDLNSFSPYEARNNNEVTQTPPAEFDYAVQKAACNQCLATPCPVPGTCLCDACFSNKFDTDHERLCNGAACSATFFKNTTDHVIPYDGQQGGAPGRYLFRDPVPNWFHYGFPGRGPSKALIGEPVFALPSDASSQEAKNKSTTYFSVTFNASFDVGVVDIDVAVTPTVAYRDGLAIRQDRDLVPGHVEGQPEPHVWTSLDAQSTFQVDAKVTVAVPLLSPWSKTFQLLKRSASAQTEPTRIIYDAGGSQGFLKYTIKSQTQDPASAYAACVRQPTTNPAAFVPTSPARFIGGVRNAAIAEVHPCNVHMCNGSTKYDCSWNSTTSSLNCTTTAGACNKCDSTFSLCNSSGQIIRQENGQLATVVADREGVFGCFR